MFKFTKNLKRFQGLVLTKCFVIVICNMSYGVTFSGTFEQFRGALILKLMLFLFCLFLWEERESKSVPLHYACYRLNILNGFLYILVNFPKNTSLWSDVFQLVYRSGPATLLKRDSSTGVFLWNFLNFYEHLSWRTYVNGSLYKMKNFATIVNGF